MAVTQYIGARYVPLFATPIEWSANNEYEPLTVVTHQGNSYTSRQAVPAGIEIGNEDFWALTGNYNAQIEQYRREVAAYDERINANLEAITNLNAQLNNFKEVTNAKFPVSSANIANNSITSEKLANGSVNTTDIADGAVTDAKLSANSVNTTKISDGSVTSSKIADKYVAIIGDSFSDGASEWASIFSNTIGKNLINKAVGRSSFTGTQGKPFTTQLTELGTDPNFPECECIIFYGGINDWNDNHATVDEMQVAFDSFLSAYASLNHQPRLIFAFGNMGMARRAQYNQYGEWHDQLMTYLHSIRMPGIVDYVPYWLFESNSTAFNSDNLHPNSIGSKIIAARMLEVYNGTYTGVKFSKALSYGGELTNFLLFRMSIHFDNGVITVPYDLNIDEYDLPSGWQNLHTESNSSAWTFGTTDDPTAKQPELYTSECMHVLLTEPSQLFRLHRVGFNTKNGTVFYQKNFGTNPTESETWRTQGRMLIAHA